MKCRRCKTNFDYETHYGICPKCAAYNRPDGKDDMKTFMGESAAAYEEEYHPPVMSEEGMEEFVWCGEKSTSSSGKKAQGKKHSKDFQERLSNPYVENTAKARKKRADSVPQKKKVSTAVSVLSAVFIMAAAVWSETGEDIIRAGKEFIDEYFSTGGYTNAVSTTISLPDQEYEYSDAWSVAGRKITFGTPYEVKPESNSLSEQESLLVIPYQGWTEDETYIEQYAVECYLSSQGLFLEPLPAYLAEELFGEENAGDLSFVGDGEEQVLIFAGDFSDLDGQIQLNLAFHEVGDASPVMFYRVKFAGEETEEIEWVREEVSEETLEVGYAAPVITKIGTEYQGQQAYDGYVFYKVTQQFENHGDTALYSVDMSMNWFDSDGNQTVYSDDDFWSTDDDMEGVLELYKERILPPKESGIKTTILQVPENCRKLKAALYFNGIWKEWQASL